jgi:serine/threonine protein kinase
LRDDLAEQFIACLDDPLLFDRDSPQLLDSIERLKLSRMPNPPFSESAISHLNKTEIGRGDSSIVRLALNNHGKIVAVKTSMPGVDREVIRREAVIHKQLKHPFVLRFREFNPGSPTQLPSIVTDFAGNGCLADHLPLRKPNRVAKIITGIAHAMQYLHSRGVWHRDLNPKNILLDWDWTVRIADFGHSLSPDIRKTLSQTQTAPAGRWPSGDLFYLAPECYSNCYNSKSDVFSFGMILYEIVVGESAFAKNTRKLANLRKMVLDGYRPAIPEWIDFTVSKRITDCWADDPDDRPSFCEIVERLEFIAFKILPEVDSAKLRKFVERHSAV